MNIKTGLFKKISIGISFYLMNAEDWTKILRRYHEYIHDIYFSPIENADYQSRKRIYNYKTHNIQFLEEELNKVLEVAKELGIYRKLVLNVPIFLNNQQDLDSIYIRYRRKYNIEYVTTFLSCANRIKEIDNSQQIICSYNQGIKTSQELVQILDTKIFHSIVIGTRFFRDFEIFNIVHKYGQKIELLVNNGCLPNCTSFCSKSNKLCEYNFKQNLLKRNINALYALCSMFPEEIYTYLLPLDIIDYYKFSTRPCTYNEMIDMLSSYIDGDSSIYIKNTINNYHLYGRLGYFYQHYKDLDYKQITDYKKTIWKKC